MGYTERDPLQRKAFLRLRERYARRGKTFVYVDESGFAAAVTRRTAYAPRGQRVYGQISGQRRPRTSLLAARIGSVFTATCLFEGTCNTRVFNAWLKHALCPLLNDRHVVILDNAAFHKSATTQQRITQTGATLLYLPPYSPDLNPIEHDFGALKKIREYHAPLSLDDLIRMYK